MVKCGLLNPYVSFGMAIVDRALLMIIGNMEKTQKETVSFKILSQCKVGFNMMPVRLYEAIGSSCMNLCQ